MTHYVVLVLTKTGKTEEVEPLLAKFDENLKVPEYEKKCSCGKYKAMEKAEKRACKELNTTWKQLRQTFNADPQNLLDPTLPIEQRAARNADINKKWQEFNRPLKEREEEILKSIKQVPAKDCDDCQGTGKVKTQYNPNSKWDWYTIGGRWSRMFGDDIIPTKKLLIDPSKPRNKSLTRAVVTPDGEWIQDGRMGYFATTMDEKLTEEEAGKQFWETLGKFPNTYAIVVDCHI